MYHLLSILHYLMLRGLGCMVRGVGGEPNLKYNPWRTAKDPEEEPCRRGPTT
jgi:hypothetical protein